MGILLLGIGIWCFLPKKVYSEIKSKKKLSKLTLVSLAIVIVLIPLTILFGVYFLKDRKYYFISLLVVLEAIVPFIVAFEKRRPKAREIVIISVLCALAICGRVIFSAFPQFKPVIAVVIISGLCFGGEAGFLVGTITAFVSNFFFGQGPFTPWQMFAYGIVGFLAGILFNGGLLKGKKVWISVFGFFATTVISGVILNSASVILWQPNPTLEMFISACVLGLPFDIVHGASTAFFLMFITEPLVTKIERIKVKYGI
ncbi:MAG: ECF transporter S component [Clostridia bacterium]|nr:ECF transporter S component [Clostridia bacterium]